MYRNCRGAGEQQGIAMEWLLWGGAVLYVFVGMAQAARNIERGMRGTGGPAVTFVFVTLFWPFVERRQHGGATEQEAPMPRIGGCRSSFASA